MDKLQKLAAELLQYTQSPSQSTTRVPPSEALCYLILRILAEPPQEERK